MSTIVLEKPASPPAQSPEQPNVEFSDQVTNVVREAMEARGITVYRLIKMTGLKNNRTYRVFSGSHPIALDELFLISLALDVEPSVLVAEALRRYDEASR